ncbi:hypothetical protein J416_12934 [Gracilibacillus halophilus YIM-C55.5]|uniref:Zincin peptidase n=2 Tax=Gracilibacillus TaxID=74385 RepID=N4WIR5_9BACI|nr:hypothetical protein J416_12934 [Gracilibacillus halophilus YIM-C55.5]
MNCWDTIQITKQLGVYRTIMLSFLLGLGSFIMLYLPFTFIHQHIEVKENGFYPFLLALVVLPILHQLTHIVPLQLIERHAKIKWIKFAKQFPYVKIMPNTKTSKRTLLISLLTPTMLLTTPLITASVTFGGYYPYFLMLAAINIGFSYTDFLYARRIWRAPKQCIITNDHNGYDILIRR